MIRPPFTPWTPPIPIADPHPSGSQQTGHQTHGTHGGGSGTSGHTASQTSAVPTLESLFQAMLQHYVPETIEFTPLDESVLSETIGNWLRPAYEQAIRNRREQTQRINAELDADAWSRGMGQSTYLSDVKERQYRDESRDVDTLESSYASELAGHLYDAMVQQQQTQIDVDRFNAEQINQAHQQALSAAQSLYNALLSGASTASGGHGSSHSGTGAGSETSMLTQLLSGASAAQRSDYRTIANLVSRMSPQERSRLYDRSDPRYLTLRSEILWSLSADEYARLMREFPGA